MKFKVGDTVKINRAYLHLAGWQKGFNYRIFTIIAINNDKCRISTKRDIGYNAIIGYEKLDLVPINEQALFVFMRDKL